MPFSQRSRWITNLLNDIFRENNINGVIDSTFSVENNSFGALKVHELKQNGASVQVTEDNKREYVKLYVNYRFMRGIEQQFLALSKGKSIRQILFYEWNINLTS